MSRSKKGMRFLLTSSAIIAAFICSLFLQTSAYALPVQPNFNHFLRTHEGDDALYDDNQVGNDTVAAQQYDDRAYPNTTVTYEQTVGAYTAFQNVARNASKWGGQSWKLVGPTIPNELAQATYTGRPSNRSGRTTALLVSQFCYEQFCPAWLGAAGGGVWLTYNALSENPTWISTSNGLASNAIGSLYQDPTDRTGRTLYVGTGEPNGSSDSEAGVGLYKSTDYGLSWHVVEGSIPAAKDRSIAAIAVDPKDAKHIYIGTAVARHGTASVVGGRFTPPGAPKVGLYESTDGGKTFKIVFSKESDVVDPTTPNGSDFFRGGISKLAYAPNGQLYFSVFDYGLYRTTNGSFEQVFAGAGQGKVAASGASRTEFALAPMGDKLRIYLGDTNGNTTDALTFPPTDFYRVDNANVPAATLTDGTANPGWLKLSNPNKGTPGYASYDFCEGQCNYDMFVASPPGHPDTVWLGGSMAYREIFTANPPSNGRAVQRSIDGGVNFTDMTNDTQSPPEGMHPDQHAIAFDPRNPDIAFTSSDGGLVRTSGSFADASAQCDTRGISGVDLLDCKNWLKAIPTRIYSINKGLSTLQFQSVSVNPKDPNNDLIGGTQDNGTWAFNGRRDTGSSSFETVGGDGGQSGIDLANPNIRYHTYYGPNGDVNFRGNDPNGWDQVTAPLTNSKEAASFYIPLLTDPVVGGTVFAGLEHVWRTQDNGGSQAYLDQHCNELSPTSDFVGCGDWVPLGPNLADTTFGTDKGGSAKAGNYVVAVARSTSDKNTLWTATRRGRVFISTNANAAPADVSFTRIDTSAQPTRFVSGIAVDPKNPNHAFVSYSGYNAYTPDTPGHVFDVTFDPASGKATWKDISNNLGDAPITAVAYDEQRGDIYIASDFGVATLNHSSNKWVPAAPGLPTAAVYGLTLSSSGRVLYAATHGRSVWRLDLK